MNTNEFTYFMPNHRSQPPAEPIDEAAAKDVAHLICGSLIYRLYESLIAHEYDVEAVTKHLEMLNDTNNNYGLLYFVYILCNSTDEALSDRFEGMTANPLLVPYLSAAIIEDC